MATVLDALVVTLGLDPTQFKKGAAEATKETKRIRDEHTKAAREIEKAGEVASNFYRKLRTEFIAFAAVLTAGRGIKDFIRDIYEGDAAAGRFAKNLGSSVEQVQTWGEAVQRTGGTADGFMATLKGLQESFQQWRLEGQSGVLPAFRHLQVQLTGTIQDLYNLHKAVQGMNRLDANEWLKRAGIADEGTRNLLLSTDKEFNVVMETVKAFGVGSKQSAEDAQALHNLLKDLQQSITSLMRTVLTTLNPVIIPALKNLTESFKNIKSSEIKEYLESIPWKEIGDGVKGFAQGADSAAQAVGGWKNATEILFGLWAGSKFLRFLRGVGLWRLALTNPMGALAAGGILAAIVGPEAAKKYGSEAPKIGDWGQGGDVPFPNTGGTPAPSGGTSNNGSGAAGGGAAPGRTEQERAQAVHDEFMRYGWTSEQAWGLAANALHESGGRFNSPTGDVGTVAGGSHGLFQWNRERLAAYRRMFGHDPEQGSLAESVQFANWELNNTEAPAGARIRSAGTAAEAGAIASRRWIRPGNDEAARASNERQRAATAARISAAGRSTPVLPPTGPAISGTTGAGTVNNTNNQAETHINGDIAIHTAATDARGIAGDLRGALRERMGVANAQMGLA